MYNNCSKNVQVGRGILKFLDPQKETRRLGKKFITLMSSRKGITTMPHRSQGRHWVSVRRQKWKPRGNLGQSFSAGKARQARGSSLRLTSLNNSSGLHRWSLVIWYLTLGWFQGGGNTISVYVFDKEVDGDLDGDWLICIWKGSPPLDPWPSLGHGLAMAGAVSGQSLRPQTPGHQEHRK